MRTQADAVWRNATPVALADAQPNALDRTGGHMLPFACMAVGPFDSLVGLERTRTTTRLFDA